MSCRNQAAPSRIVELRDHRRPLRARAEAAAELRARALERDLAAAALIVAGRIAEARAVHEDARALVRRARILEDVEHGAALAEIDAFLRQLDGRR